jgi:hypothetical protein
MQPSCLSRKVLYIVGPSSSLARCVMTKEGSISPSRSFPKAQANTAGRASGHAERQSAIDCGAHRDFVEETAIDADDRNHAKVPAALDRLTQHMGSVRTQEYRHLGAVDHGIEAGRRFRFGSDCVDARVGATAVRQLLDALVDVLLLEV